MACLLRAFSIHVHLVRLCSQREPAVERLVRFVASLATARDADNDGDDDAFHEALLRLLVPLTDAADKAVRFRSCQLVAAILNGLSAEAGLADDLYVELSDAMTQRMRDKAPAVRAEAARALARLQVRGVGNCVLNWATCPAVWTLTPSPARLRPRTRVRQATLRTTR